MSKSADATAIIRDRAGTEPVRLGLILGSGLGPLADDVDGVRISYADLPGFPVSKVSGHAASLSVGTLMGVRVAVFGGRAHFYEEGDPATMRTPLQVLGDLGGDTVIVTNAAGSMRPDMPTGEIMCLSDHINFSGRNPLIGEPTDARFVNMTDAYDPDLRRALRTAADATGTAMRDGVYAWYSGPSFETPAEIRALQMLGGDAVGMSTVPEVILGRFLGLRCAGLSAITNMAAGLSDEAIGHDHTKAMAPIGAAKLQTVLRRFLADY